MLVLVQHGLGQNCPAASFGSDTCSAAAPEKCVVFSPSANAGARGRRSELRAADESLLLVGSSVGSRRSSPRRPAPGPPGADSSLARRRHFFPHFFGAPKKRATQNTVTQSNPCSVAAGRARQSMKRPATVTPRTRRFHGNYMSSGRTSGRRSLGRGASRSGRRPAMADEIGRRRVVQLPRPRTNGRPRIQGCGAVEARDSPDNLNDAYVP